MATNVLAPVYVFFLVAFFVKIGLAVAEPNDFVRTVEQGTSKSGFWEQLLDPNSSYRRWEMEHFWLLFSFTLCLGLIFIAGTFFLIRTTTEVQPTTKEDKKTQ